MKNSKKQNRIRGKSLNTQKARTNYERDSYYFMQTGIEFFFEDHPIMQNHRLKGDINRSPKKFS